MSPVSPWGRGASGPYCEDLEDWSMRGGADGMRLWGGGANQAASQAV